MVVEPVGDEDMQHLGRADAVEHGLAGPGDPFVVDGRGQRFARRDGGAQGREVRALLHGAQHDAVGGRRGEGHGGAERLDDLDHVGR